MIRPHRGQGSYQDRAEAVALPLFSPWIVYCFESPRVAQRDKTKQASNSRNEGISLKRQSEKGVRQRRAWREKEEQAERRCGKCRNLPDKSVEHERGYFQSLTASYETTFPHRLRDAHGKQACSIACLSPMREAKRQMALHLCRQVSRNISKKSKQAGCYAVVTSAKPKTFAKVAGRP